MRQEVLFVNHALELGGAELTLLSLFEERPQEAAVTLAVPHEGPLAERARGLGIRVEIAGPGKDVLGIQRHRGRAALQGMALAALTMGPALTKLAVLARRHSLVVTNSTKAHLYGAAAAKAAGVRSAWRLHDVIDAEGFAAPVRHVYAAAARSLPHRIVAVSEAAANPMREAGAKDVLVCPNGVDLAAFRAGAEAGARIRRELGIAPKTPVVLMLGRLTPLKGAEVLFEALRQLPQVTVVLAGEATFAERAGYGRELREKAKPFGDRVIFAGFRKDVPALLAAADVLVHPSVKPDSLPTVVLEALAAGVPVVASTAGGAAEILRDEEGGLLVPPGDATTLADAVTHVLGDPALRDTLLERGRRRALDYGRPFATVRVWRALLETLPA